ncbi:MAG: (2Fe-2S)-binding protein [Alicyclobacillaceae bacterium]|nr:(2Fe-2S)-binding protein [Alicyclobacillaceae bacterium]
MYFKTSGKRIEIGPEGEAHVLRTSIRYECDLPFKCAGGLCGTCKMHVDEGMENLSPVRKAEQKLLGDLLNEGYRLGCQTFAHGDCTISWDPAQQQGKPLKKLADFWEKHGGRARLSPVAGE